MSTWMNLKGVSHTSMRNVVGAGVVNDLLKIWAIDYNKGNYSVKMIWEINLDGVNSWLENKK